MNTPRINSQITFHRTCNLERIHQFYNEILGFPLALDQGTCRIYRVCKGSFIGFCLKEDINEGVSDIIFTVVTSNVDEWFNYLSNNGVVFTKQPEMNFQYQIYHCFFQDPDGNMIEFQEFHDPRWNQNSS